MSKETCLPADVEGREVGWVGFLAGGGSTKSSSGSCGTVGLGLAKGIMTGGPFSLARDRLLVWGTSGGGKLSSVCQKVGIVCVSTAVTISSAEKGWPICDLIFKGSEEKRSISLVGALLQWRLCATRVRPKKSRHRTECPLSSKTMNGRFK